MNDTCSLCHEWIVFLIGLTLCLNLSGQPESKLGTWNGFSSNQRVAERWQTFIQGEFRTWEAFANFNELLWRGAIKYDINSRHKAAVGYVRVDTWPYDDEPYGKFWENRAYEEYLFKHTLSVLNFEHRVRLEQRWITLQEGETNYSNRFRYLLNAIWNLRGSDGSPSRWFAKIFNEIFLDFDRRDYWFDREAGESGLNQNRLYAGIGYRPIPSSNIQLGALWQHRPMANFYRIVLSYAHNFDFRKL